MSSTAADSGTSRYACHHKRGTAWTLHFVSPRAFSAPSRLIIFEMLWFLSTSRVTRPTHAESPQYRNSTNGNVTFRRHRRQNFILLVSGSTRRQLKNVPPNATALECIKCTLGGITLAEPHNFRGLPPSVKIARYFSCYTTSVTLQSTPNARSAEGKASPPNAPAVAGTYGRIEAPQPHF